MSKTIVGDVAVGRHVYTGGDANVAGSATIKGNVKVDGWLDAKNIKHTNKGLFPTEEKLREAYPEPKRGWYALVGATIPAQVYIVVDGKWVYSDNTSEDLNVDLTDYITTTTLESELQGFATSDEVDALSNEFNTHKASMADEVDRIDAELAEQRTDINGVISLSNNALEVANQASAQVGEMSGKVDEYSLTLETHTSLIAENTSALETINTKNREQDEEISNTAQLVANNTESFFELENQLMSFKDEVDVRNTQVDNKFSSIETTNAKQTLWHEAHSIINLHRFIAPSVIDRSIFPEYMGEVPSQLVRIGLIIMINTPSGWESWQFVNDMDLNNLESYKQLDWDNSLLITEVNALKSKINSEVANLTLEDEALASKIEEMGISLTAEIDLRKAKDTEQAALISHATDLADQADSGAVRANSRLDSLDLLVRELELRLDAYGDRITALENQ